MRIETLDLEFRDTPRTIAAFLVFGEGSAGAEGPPVLVECGPASTLPALERELARRGVRLADVRHVLVTHIHLDHAGAAGWLARNGARIYVHERGAPHLIDPSRLLRSASRIYGALMDAMWGRVTPAPPDRVTAVRDGETIDVAGLRFEAIETPGHARHHHVFRLGNVAFTGDAAGIRVPTSKWIDLPAPPPEFELDAWVAALKRLRSQGFETIYRTHFGASREVSSELDRFERLLREAVEFVRDLEEAGADRDQLLARYSALMVERARAAGAGADEIRAYEIANPRAMSVDGISRYLAGRDG